MMRAAAGQHSWITGNQGNLFSTFLPSFISSLFPLITANQPSKNLLFLPKHSIYVPWISKDLYLTYLWFSFPAGLCGCSPLLLPQRRGRCTPWHWCKQCLYFRSPTQWEPTVLWKFSENVLLSGVLPWLHLCTTLIHTVQTVLKVSHQRWSPQSPLVCWASLWYRVCAL